MDHISSGHHPNKKRKVAHTDSVVFLLSSNLNAAKVKIKYTGVVSVI